jgi:hypothetical protein
MQTGHLEICDIVGKYAVVGKLHLASSSVSLPPLQVKEIRYFYPLPIFIVMVPLQLIVTANKIFTSYY